MVKPLSNGWYWNNYRAFYNFPPLLPIILGKYFGNSPNETNCSLVSVKCVTWLEQLASGYLHAYVTNKFKWLLALALARNHMVLWRLLQNRPTKRRVSINWRYNRYEGTSPCSNKPSSAITSWAISVEKAFRKLHPEGGGFRKLAFAPQLHSSPSHSYCYQYSQSLINHIHSLKILSFLFVFFRSTEMG